MVSYGSVIQIFSKVCLYTLACIDILMLYVILLLTVNVSLMDHAVSVGS